MPRRRSLAPAVEALEVRTALSGVTYVDETLDCNHDDGVQDILFAPGPSTGQPPIVYPTPQPVGPAGPAYRAVVSPTYTAAQWYAPSNPW